MSKCCGRTANWPFTIGIFALMLCGFPVWVAAQTSPTLPSSNAPATATGLPQPPVSSGLQTPSPSPATNELAPKAASTIEAALQQVLDRLQQLASDTEMLPEIKQQIAKSYEQSRLDLENAIKARQKRLEATEAAASAPAMLEATKNAKATQLKNQPIETAEDLQFLSFDELNQERLTLEAELATTISERTKLTESSSNREKRRKELPQLISDTKAKLEQISKQPPATATTDTPQLKQAADLSNEAAKLLLSEQLQGYEAEQRRYEAEAVLLPQQIELAQDNEKWLQEQLRVVNEELEKIRTNQILSTYREANELLADTPDELKPLANQLIEHISAWMDLSRKRAELTLEMDEAQKLLDKWSQRRTQMDGRVDPKPGSEGVGNVIAGFNSWVGLMLRKQRGELPETNQLESKIRDYQREMQEAESLLFDLEDALQEIKLQEDLLDARNSATKTIAPSGGSSQPAILSFSKSTIHAITLDVNGYQNDLYELADVRDNTIKLTENYREFIDRHVLWIRSTEQLKSADWQPGLEGFRWLVDFQNWRRVGQLIASDAFGKPGWYLLLVVGPLLIFFNQSLLRRRLAEQSTKAEKNNCTSFRLTARSLLISLLLALPAPMCLLFFHWRLKSIPEADSEFATSLANGLLLAMLVFTPLEILRQLCRPGGLGVKHFSWKEKNALRLRKNLRWLIDFTVPLTIIVGMFSEQSNQRWESSFGRAAFVLLMPNLSIFLARVFTPRGGIANNLIESNRGGWMDRLSFLWYPALVGAPLVLSIVSIIGYHYTAQRFAFHFVTTLWATVGLIIVYTMLMRWLVLNRRRLMLSQARQRLEDASRRDPQGESSVPIDEARVDLVAINEQTKRLVTSIVVASGCVLIFFIWSDVLPAVAMLENVQVWPLQKDASPDAVVVTLANVLLVIPIIVMVIIAGRNVPGLLEIAFLQHLPLTNAARYAITTVSRYAIFAMGIVTIFSMVGLRWSSIQWLVAALGVGLGFGLQEIFANFVSGIILLFEQPIRVGDVVSIDGITGSVSKIRMRATTIVNWDRQELIVPNKDLITGKLLNWTLSDSTNRIIVNVGIAYGSNPIQACEIIMNVCREHPNILIDPKPTVTFENFGDNSLSIVLRAFLESLDNRLTTIHDLHHRIYLELNTAGIEISFPQRDLHIRSLPDNWNRWLDQLRPTNRTEPNRTEPS